MIVSLGSWYIKSHTTPRIIKLLLGIPKTPIKALPKKVNLTNKLFSQMAHCVLAYPGVNSELDRRGLLHLWSSKLATTSSFFNETLHTRHEDGILNWRGLAVPTHHTYDYQSLQLPMLFSMELFTPHTCANSKLGRRGSPVPTHHTNDNQGSVATLLLLFPMRLFTPYCFVCQTLTQQR